MRPLLSARTHLRTCLIPGANARKARIPSWPARVLVTVTLALLAACSQQELYGQLTERQANEMVAVLRNAGLHAEKAASRDGKAFVVSTRPDDFSRAVEILHAGGFPRDSFDTLGQVFKKEGFVSSALEERARFTHALSQELSATLSSIDGVVQARVHVSVPEKNPLSDKPQHSTASVFIKHRPGVDLSQQTGKIKALVVNAMEGLPYDNVTVALFPAEPIPPAAPQSLASALWSQYGSLLLFVTGLGFLITGGVVVAAWWQRREAAVQPSPQRGLASMVDAAVAPLRRAKAPVVEAAPTSMARG